MARPPEPQWHEFLGPEIGWRTVCTYTTTVGGPICGVGAKWHLWLAEGHGYVGACDGHIAVARVELELTGEHEWGAWCNLPGSIWKELPPMSWCEQESGDPFATLAAEQAHVQESLSCS